MNLNAQGKYVEAGPLLRNALDINRKVLGDDHPATATSYNNVAGNLKARGKYAEAAPLFQKALDINRKVLGEEHANTANSYNNVAGNLKSQGKYAEAGPLYQKALDIKLKALGEEHPDTAVGYSGVGMNLNAQGKYVEAGPLLRKALDINRKVLGDDHPATATSYNNVAFNLHAQGKFADGRPLFQKALDIRRKVLGEDHPDTATSYNNVASNLNAQGKFAEAEPLFRKALDICREILGEDHPDTAASYNSVASNLDDQGKFAEAEPLFRKALDINRKVLGEDHPDTAMCYNNAAENLNAQGKHAKAGHLHQRALDINRKFLGEDHPATAMSYNNVAMNLNAQGKYVEAGPLLQKALDINRKFLGEDHPTTATSYNNIAFHLDAQGKFAQAGPLYQKALDIRRRILGEDHPTTATSYINVAFNLNAQGKYVEAGPLLQKALDINRKFLGEDHPTTATCYNNLAFNLDAQGKFAQAGPLYQKALDINRKFLGEDHPTTAMSHNNVAMYLSAQGKYLEAGPFLQKALDIRRKFLGEDHPDTAQSYHNLAGHLGSQGKYVEAVPFVQKALDIRRKHLGEDHPTTAMSYNNVAMYLSAQGKYVEALAALDQAASVFDMARLDVGARGLERAVYSAERPSYAFLAAARGRAGRAREAWNALEADLGRGLLEEMSGRYPIPLTAAEQRARDEALARRAPVATRILALVSRPQRSPAENQELQNLIDERRRVEQELGELAAMVNRRQVATLEQLQKTLPADAAFVAWVDAADKSGAFQEHWGCVVRSQGEPHWQRLPGSSPEQKWTKDDSKLPSQFRAALAGSATAVEIEGLAQKLYAQRLAPLQAHLAGVKQLFIAPVWQMASIPIEALTDEFTVSYAASGTFLARLKGRDRLRSDGVLAIGDPEFPPEKDAPQPTALPPNGILITQVVPMGNAASARLLAGDVIVSYAGTDLKTVEDLDKVLAANANAKSVVVKVWREGQKEPAERELAGGRLGVGVAKEPAREAITARRETDRMIAKVNRGGKYHELAGTQVEITRLAGLFDPKQVTTLTRAEASEQKLDEMRKADKLKLYRYVHFATHGEANNFRSFDSALILTPPEKVPEPLANEPWLDGRLTAAEVLEYWRLDAELVTLSACESALGRHGGGDGLLGFTQAFLLAGSRSVCLSLWQVDDTATALLMDRFYRNLLGKREDGAKPMGKAVALHEAKQWLRNLTSTEALERFGNLTNGVVRSEQPLRKQMKPVPIPKDAGKDHKPYAHPHYWAAFILIGDPE
jgi:CHAT domain-containing protein/tetratricopeptide (TPR) repeat protein